LRRSEGVGLFAKKVYAYLKKVPKGKVTTYKELANTIGSKAYRAVGSALSENKDPVKVPCYRVVCSDGTIGRYSAAGGLKKKIELLKKDGIKIKNGKIDLQRFGFRF